MRVQSENSEKSTKRGLCTVYPDVALTLVLLLTCACSWSKNFTIFIFP